MKPALTKQGALLPNSVFFHRGSHNFTTDHAWIAGVDDLMRSATTTAGLCVRCGCVARVLHYERPHQWQGRGFFRVRPGWLRLHHVLSTVVSAGQLHDMLPHHQPTHRRVGAARCRDFAGVVQEHADRADAVQPAAGAQASHWCHSGYPGTHAARPGRWLSSLLCRLWPCSHFHPLAAAERLSNPKHRCQGVQEAGHGVAAEVGGWARGHGGHRGSSGSSGSSGGGRNSFRHATPPKARTSSTP